MTFNRINQRRRPQTAFHSDVMRHAFCAALVFCLASLAALADDKELQPLQTFDTKLGPVEITQSVTPENATTFEPFEMTVEIRKPKSAFLAPDDLAGVYGDFNVEFLGDQEREIDDSTNVVARKWTLYPTRRGELALPPIPLTITIPSDSAASESESVFALVPQQTLTIPQTDAPVRSVDDIASSLEPIRQFSVGAILVSILALAGLALALRFVLARKTSAEETPALPMELPYDKAIRKLDELKNSRSYLENEPGFYIEDDAILREFLAAVFSLNALEMTTQELVKKIDSDEAPSFSDLLARLDQYAQDVLVKTPSEEAETAIALGVLKEPEFRASITAALTKLDLVKFAKLQTSFEDASEIYALTRKIVERSFATLCERLAEYRSSLAKYVETAAASLNESEKQDAARNVSQH